MHELKPCVFIAFKHSLVYVEGRGKDFPVGSDPRH